MVMFDGVALIDMQENHKHSLLRSNPDYSAQHLETIIQNQKHVLDHCTQEKVPAAIITYKRRGDLLNSLEDSVEQLPVKTWIRKTLPHKEERIDESWKDELTAFYERHGASKIFLMGMYLDSCVYDTALHLSDTGHKVLTAADVVDNPQMFPGSTKPGHYESRWTYLDTYKEAL